MNKLKSLFFFTLIITLISCKKEDDVTDFLTYKIWRPSLTDKNPASNPRGRVLYNFILDCNKDDYYTFEKNGKLVINYGRVKCDDKQPDSETKDYTYNTETKELIIDNIKFTIADENKNQLKYYTYYPFNTDFLIFLFK